MKAQIAGKIFVLATLILAAAGLVIYCLNASGSYYSDFNYRVVLASGAAIVLIVIQQVLYRKLGDQLWLDALYPAVSVLLAVAAVIFIGARVESAAMILASELEAGNANASSALLQSFIGIGCFIAGILVCGIAGCFRQEATT